MHHTVKVTVLSFYFLTFGFAEGQDMVTELQHFLHDVESLDQLKSIKKAKFDSFDLLVFVDLIERDIDFDYRHHRFLILPVYGPHVHLNLISRDGIIEGAWLWERIPTYHGFITGNVVLLGGASKNVLDEYIFKHNQLYETKLSSQDMISQLSNLYEVGYDCGLRGTWASKKTREAMTYVAKKRKKELNKLLTSISPELQTLGALGLLSIDKLNKTQTRIIIHLTQRNSVINSCKGEQSGFGERFADRVEFP
nr:hypothetical protein [Allomuricauda sp.]